MAPAPAPAPASAQDPRNTILEVEALVAGAATLLVLQLFFGLCRRRSSSIWIQGALWLAYTLSLPLITYTFGLMQSSGAKSALYPVWAISLFLVAGCSISVTAYDLDETKKWKKQLFELAQQYVYSGLIFMLLSPSHLSVLDEFVWTPQKFGPILDFCYALAATITFTNLFRVIACWMATFSDPSKVVADYMRDQVDSGGGDHHQLQQPQGYLVWWYGYFVDTHGANAHNYRTRLDEDDSITLGKIWDACHDGLFDDPDGTTTGSQSKDVCLSFALFHLLKRRYFGIDCHEAGHKETRDFVLNWLLASQEEEEDGKRAFRVIEAELAFLHDFFFTKFASIYENEVLFFLTFIMKAILIVILGVLVHLLRIKTKSPVIQVENRKVDMVITLTVVGVLLVVEILQTVFYLASDWALVSLACSYVRKGPCQGFMYSFLRHPIHLLRKQSFFFKYWKNKIGQYSVIKGSRWYKVPPQQKQPNINMVIIFIHGKLQMLVHEIAWKIRTCQYCRSIVQDIRLPDTLKSAIASSIKSTAYGPLTNGAASLERNGVLRQFGETLKSEDWDLAETMLIWHVATDYCDSAAAESDRNSGHGELRRYHEVATHLSKYSAYLMAFVPELLPGNPADTSFTFDKVMQEAAETLYPGQLEDTRGRGLANREMLARAFDHRSRSPDEENNHNTDTIIFRGLKLGRELETHVAGEELRWKVMAEFWAEIILYVAPSDNVRSHVEKLANGGEFITHVWALLSHAGILTRHPTPRQQELSQTPC